MESWLRVFQSVRYFPIFILTIVLGVGFVVASASFEASQCNVGSGWKWTIGLAQPEIAAEVRQGLGDTGIEAAVVATGSGETDPCGNYIQYAVDFDITLKAPLSVDGAAQQSLIERVSRVVARFGRPNLGRVAINFPSGETIILDRTSSEYSEDFGRTHLGSSDETWVRKVYVVVYDPLLSNGQLLSDYLNWYDHETLTQGTIGFFSQASGDRLIYTVVATTVITDGWPEKIDGYQYTEDEYLAVINGQAPPHDPDTVDYNKIVNDPQLDICGKANRSEIDEVWIYNGPYFGFYESTLVGPGAYWYNSPPVTGPWSCNRLIPIMGPSPHVGLPNAIHNFGHRTEATMTQVYGSWDQNSTDHNWERFALVDALSPDYTYSGCGNVHYPPNGTSDYDYENPLTALSNCDDFANYPELGDPADTVQPVSCSSWGCTDIDYYMYWFGHLPSNVSCGPDSVASDWWKYFIEPALALNPSAPCQSKLYLPIILESSTQNVPGPLAFIALGGDNALSVMDTQNNTIVASNIPLGSFPHSMVLSADGEHLYVTNNNANTITVLNTTTYGTVATVAVGSNPRGIAVSNDGTRVYVANNASQTLSIIDTTTLEVVNTTSLTSHPEQLAITPDGQQLFIAANTPDAVFVVDTALVGSIVTQFDAGHANGIGITPNGQYLYITDGTVFESGRVVVVDAMTYVIINEIPVGVGPHRVAVGPDGQRVYIANFGSNSVSVIDTLSNSVVATIFVDGVPWAMDLLDDGTRLYVPVDTGEVVVVDTATHKIVHRVTVGSLPTAVAVLHQ